MYVLSLFKYDVSKILITATSQSQWKFLEPILKNLIFSLDIHDVLYNGNFTNGVANVVNQNIWFLCVSATTQF